MTPAMFTKILGRPGGILLLLAGLVFVSRAWAIDPDELLKIDDAFKISAQAASPDIVEVSWEIAEGYFLYRHRFNFSTTTPGVELGPPDIPPGKPKVDEFFGDVETYRNKITIAVPFKSTAAALPEELELTAGSQGCADVGVCYPPHKQTVKVSLPVAQTSAPEAEQPGLFSRLGSSLSGKLFGGQKEFLPPEQAFVLSADVIDPYTLALRWDIAEGYYLYRDKFAFALKQGDGVTLLPPQSPAGEFKVDESFGRMEVYHNDVKILLPLKRDSVAAQEIVIEARYQGCAEAGFCYPPMNKDVPIKLVAAPAGGPSAVAPAEPTPGYVSEQDAIAATLASGASIKTLAIFFGLGLLLAFTPCIFPMVPILSSIIVGQGSGLSTRKAFTLSLVYVLPMALTYTVAGVIAGMTGQNLQAAFQEPWLVATFAAIFVALALSMFGFYDLQLPSALQSKLSNMSNKQKGGSYIGVGIMGFLSALIVGPCVAAPLAGALIYISQSGDAVFGGMALFALSLGMGSPLLLIGTSAGKLLPKVGGWMNTVKAVFGVMLLGLAIWMLERILPSSVTLALWGVLAIVSGVYLGALRRLDVDATGWRQFWQGMGVVSLLYGVLLIIGAAGGGRDVLQPLKGVFAGTATAGTGSSIQHELAFQKVKGWSGVEAALAAAAAQNKPVMLDFYADWCVSCKEMEKYTFSDGAVQASLAGVIMLQADVTENDDDDQILLKHFGIFGPPAILFFDRSGTERKEFRVVGFMKAAQFKQTIDSALESKVVL